MKKCLVSIIAAMMMFSVVTPIQSSSVSAQEKTSTTVEKGSKERVLAFQPEVELVEERTSTSQVFKQADGAHRMEISPEPIHVQNEKTKKWEPIDNKLIEKETGRFHNAKNEFDASFSPDSQSKEPLVSLEQQGKTVAIESMEQNGDAVASVEALIEENKVTYEDVYPHTDLIYTVGNDKVKEDILLKEKPTAELPLSYDFEFKIEGLVLEETEDGYFFLADKKTNERVFAIEKPFMIDSLIPEGFVTNMEGAMPEGALSDSVKMTASQKGDVLSLSLAPDMEWLLDPERIYPVTIDPTIKMHQPKNDLNDTTIRSALPDTTGGADTELGTGLHQSSSSNNIVRSLIQFDTGTLPKGAKVMSAQLNLHLSSVWNDTPTSIQLFEAGSAWEENRATWNRRTLNALWSAKGGDYKQPSLASQTIGVLNPTLPEPPMYKWGIAPEVAQKWMDQPAQNLGLMLKAQNETLATYKKFYSGDASGTTGALKYSPKLSIVYYPISRLGLENYWSYAEHGLSDGQGYVNLGTGNLVLESTDFSLVGRGNSGFSFSRTFNSKGVEDSPIGYGWSFVGSETLSEFPNKDVLMQQADGTTHLFYYDNTTAKYIAPKGLYLELNKANSDAFVITDNSGNRIVYRDLIKNPEIQTRIYPIEYEEDRNKNKITYKRLVDGTLTGIEDATGRMLSFQQEKGRITSTSYEGKKTSSYTYYGDGRLKTATILKDESFGSTTTYQYNSLGELSTIVDANNNITEYIYEKGFLKSIQQPLISDENSNITYDYSNLANYEVSETNSLNGHTIYKVNSNYLITALKDPMGYTSAYTYDSDFNLISTKDPKNHEIVNKYDAKGNLLSSQESQNTKTIYTYDNYNQPLTITDANGTINYKYNNYGDLISEKNALGEETIYTYYEPYGNLKSLRRADGSQELYEYDDQQTYLTKTTDILNRQVSLINDSYGNVTQVTDSNKNIIKYKYDRHKRLVSITEPGEITTSYTYDSNGNLLSKKNGNGYITKFSYNSQNQLNSYTEPLGQVNSLKYDAAGNPVEELKSNGTTIINTKYDENNRPTDVKINNYLKWHYSYDQNGNKTAIENKEINTIFTYTYDEMNQVKTESNGNQITEYSYSPSREVTGIKGYSNVDSFNQVFKYDSQDRLKHIYQNGAVQTGLDYTSVGLLAELRHVNGVHSYYTYNTAQQMKTLKVSKGTTVLFEETNSYDLNGNITAVTSLIDEKIFKYDSRNQLIKEEIPGSELFETYEYDDVGNRITKTSINKESVDSFTYIFNANNQLVKVNDYTFMYDLDGNRIKDGKFNYTYNKFDQLTSVKNHSGKIIASYSYDDKGRRVRKIVDGVTTNYHYNQNFNVLFETDENGNITAEYTYDSNGFPVTMTKKGVTYYYIYNSKQEIIALTDKSGITVASYSYDAWGNVKSQSGFMANENPLRYKGYRYDIETNLYYLIARYYQPEEGVFLAPDPLGGDIGNPGTQNGYNYVSNNPIKYFDPSGHKQEAAPVAGGGGIPWSIAAGTVIKVRNGVQLLLKDWEHIRVRHMVGKIPGKTLFPKNLTQAQVKNLVMDSVSKGKVIKTQSDGTKIYSYKVNKYGIKVMETVVNKSKQIVTSYPTSGSKVKKAK